MPKLLDHLQHSEALQRLRVLLEASLLIREPRGEGHCGAESLNGGDLGLCLGEHTHRIELTLKKIEDAPHFGYTELKEALGP